MLCAIEKEEEEKFDLIVLAEILSRSVRQILITKT